MLHCHLGQQWGNDKKSKREHTCNWLGKVSELAVLLFAEAFARTVWYPDKAFRRTQFKRVPKENAMLRVDLWLSRAMWIVGVAVAGCGGRSSDVNPTAPVTGGNSSTGGTSAGGAISIGGGMLGGAPNGGSWILPSGGMTSMTGGMPGCYPAILNQAWDAGPNCGNGIVEVTSGEACDDGNRLSGDGCSTNCQIEPSWVCSSACEPCVRRVVCGDGVVGPGEVCDDGNTSSDDGCDGNCNMTEPGWSCPIPGHACQPLTDCGTSCGDAGVCGDGIVQPPETCDNGINDGSYGGCTPDCQMAAYCGDDMVNGNEQCDFGSGNSPPNNAAYGSCMVDCQPGPHCGDGIVQSPEECDLGPDNGAPVLLCSLYCKIMWFEDP